MVLYAFRFNKEWIAFQKEAAVGGKLILSPHFKNCQRCADFKVDEKEGRDVMLAKLLHWTRSRVGRSTWSLWVDIALNTQDGSVFCSNGDPKQVQTVCARACLCVFNLTCSLVQLPFGSQVDTRVGVQRTALSMKLPAYTNEQFGNDVTYFPTVSMGSEDGNLLITCFMYQLKLHHERTGRWPRVIYLAVDSKRTNQCYDFVSALVEIVQLRPELGVEEAFVLFSEPGHHIMHIEHCHSRVSGWFKTQDLVDSVHVFRDKLHGRTENACHFLVCPVSWIFDFKRRYEGCINTVTTQLANIDSRRLVRVTRQHVFLFSEPTTDPKYPDDLNLGPHSLNKIQKIDCWFFATLHEHRNPWAPVQVDKKNLRNSLKNTRDCPNFVDMVNSILDEHTNRTKHFHGRTSATPEFEPFWRARQPAAVPQVPVAPQPPAVARAPQNMIPAAPVPVANPAAAHVVVPAVPQPEQAPVPLAPVISVPPPVPHAPVAAVVAPPVAPARRRDPTAPLARRYIRIVALDPKPGIYSCYIRSLATDGITAQLTTQTRGLAGEEWDAQLFPQHEGDMHHEDGWEFITPQRAVELSRRGPEPFVPRSPHQDPAEPAAKRPKTS